MCSRAGCGDAVEGGSEGHWCTLELGVVMQLKEALKDAGVL